MLYLATVLAPSFSRPRVTLEDGHATSASSSWREARRCTKGEVSVMVMLKKTTAQLRTLEDTFWAVSEPDGPRYGDHLNAAQLSSMIGASDAAISTVVEWLKGEGAGEVEVASTKDAISATLSCASAEAAFATRITTFQHTRHERLALHRASASYSLPSEIAKHVSIVGDLIGLPEVRKPLVPDVPPSADDDDTFPTNASCNGKCNKHYVTPEVLRLAYSLGNPPTTANGSIAVAEFQGQDYDPKDLTAYSDACGVDIKVTAVGRGAEGAKCAVPLFGTELCGEALLDIEYAGALVGAVPLFDVSNHKYSLLKWATQVSGMASPPLVHSVSYGNDEAQQTSTDYMLEANAAFMKLGAMGISVLFASGDQGVLGREGYPNDPRGYHPDFPAASPYITAVGGTDFVTKGVVGAEKAWSLGGGGFSKTFAAPAYQKDAVAAYLSAAGGALPPAAKWNATGRAYPDVAALGGEQNPYCIRAGSMFAGVAGTSASCPVVAAVVAKLNELRLAKGGKPLGFLNPWIYKVGAAGAFNDVTSGRNCGRDTCTTEGFPAIAGWDAATGFGTPNFEKLSQMI